MPSVPEPPWLQTRTDAGRVFFPAAALYAAMAVPLAVFAMTSGQGWPPGLVGAGHGREMFFGFALALVTGYLLGPLPRWQMLALLGLWLAARGTAVFAPALPAGQVLTPAFALMLAWQVIPRFGNARKWRNRAVMPLLAAIALLPTAWLWRPRLPDWPLAELAVLLFGLLMLFMGGRLIAPAAAGAFQTRGLHLDARVQPRVEAAIILLPAGAVVALMLPHGRAVAGVLALAAGLLAAVRLARWRLWRCRRPDLWALGSGYGWVALGLVWLGTALLAGNATVNALHLMTVGGLGTLSTGVMARQHFQRQWRKPPPAGFISAVTGLIALAVLARLGAGLHHDMRFELLWVAAAGWSIAYCWLALHLLFNVSPVRPVRPGATA